MLAFAGENRADFDALNRRGFNFGNNRFGDFFTSGNDDLAGCWVNDVVY